MSCNALRARRTITSTCNMGWKKLINQNVVPMGATSWQIKLKATKKILVLLPYVLFLVWLTL